DEVGLMDERFFLYGEDLDLCYRANLAGWGVHYLPSARVIHHKGGSSRRNFSRAHYEFHKAMAIFHRKHFAHSHGVFLNGLVYAGIWSRALASWPVRYFAQARRKVTAV